MSSPIILSKAIGGGKEYGGEQWDDIYGHKPMIIGISKIDICASDIVDSIQVTYLCADGSLYTASKHGGSERYPSTIIMATDERMVRVEGKTNYVVVNQLTFISRHSNGTERKHGPYGKAGKTPFVIEGKILGFNGRVGDSLDGLGVYYRTLSSRHILTSEMFGGCGGSVWDDNIINHKPMIIGIYKIDIYADDEVDAIRVTYFCEDGSLYTASKHGGYGGYPSHITLDSDERIVLVKGKTNNAIINQLTFISKSRDGTERKHGPYGMNGKTPFEIEGNILGFKGRATYLLDGLGVFYISTGSDKK